MIPVLILVPSSVENVYGSSFSSSGRRVSNINSTMSLYLLLTQVPVFLYLDNYNDSEDYPVFQ